MQSNVYSEGEQGPGNGLLNLLCGNSSLSLDHTGQYWLLGYYRRQKLIHKRILSVYFLLLTLMIEPFLSVHTVHCVDRFRFNVFSWYVSQSVWVKYNDVLVSIDYVLSVLCDWSRFEKSTRFIFTVPSILKSSSVVLFNSTVRSWLV